MISVSYQTKTKIMKIFLEVISNTKILLNEEDNDQDFVKLTGRLDNVEYGKYVYIKVLIKLLNIANWKIIKDSKTF